MRLRLLHEWRLTLRALRLTASVIASTLLLATIGAVVFFLLRDSSDDESIELTCDGCPSWPVIRVIDGDTLNTSIGTIRIYGADAPEQGERCFTEATDEMRRLAGSEVRGEPGPRATDQFGRRLFYLYTESGDSIDELLIRNGFAEAWTFDGQHVEVLTDAEEVARASGVGCLWQ